MADTGLPKPTSTKSLAPKVRDIYAQSFRNHRRYSGLIVKNEIHKSAPFFVSLETLTLCNAACEFCPYPTLERKGLRMPEALFQKIVDDLAGSCPHQIPNWTLNRVSEPFLDTRTFDFAHYIVSRFPGAKVNRVTNASALTDKLVDKLIDHGNTGYVKISFNDHRPEHYERTMRLPFERTFKNVKRLHERVVAQEFPYYVMIGRVGDGTIADAEFVEWCHSEFPRFVPVISPRFDWMGYTHSFDTGVLGQKCSQWFQLHFLADGKEALCCIDHLGVGMGDANTQNAYDIYMHPRRKEMREAKSRRDVSACERCTALV